MSRTKKLARNSLFGVIGFVVAAVLGFVIRIFFVDFFDYELLGLQAILTTIITTLSLAELGIGMAIVFSLYKPLAEKDETKIALLIKLYKKIFYIIAFIILGVGLLLLPLLPLIVTEFSFMQILWPYLITLVGTVASYLFSYNHTILSADQRNFVISIVNTFTKIIIAVAQLAVLFIFQNFILFVTAYVILMFLANVFLAWLVRKQYPFLKKKVTGKLEKEDLKTIKTKVTALVFHKIGNHFVTGIDNITISIFLGAVIVGYYANYVMISTYIFMLVSTIASGLVASFGNLVATEDRTYVKEVFHSVRLAFLIMYGIIISGIFVLSGQFLTLWLSEETVLPLHVVLIWAVNAFIIGYSAPAGGLRAAAGVFEPDKYLHIALAVINLAVSIVLVQFMGLAGILLGTTLCLILKEVLTLPRIVCKHIFKESAFGYYKKMLLDFFLVALSVVACYFVNEQINTGIAVLDFLLGGVLCVGLPAAVIVSVYARTREMKRLIQTGKNLLKKANNNKGVNK